MTSAVTLVGVGKKYTKIDDTPTLAGRAIAMAARRAKEELWAVRDVSLDIAAGERVGVIGRNGAGKSTMLRLLAGVSAPTEGSVLVRGRVAPLLSVGVGFHPEMTGRENVFVNGVVLGLSRQEVRRRFDEIVDFAGIARFLDTPVKFYSSGMFVRLGFAVAVLSTPDVLIVDEVLAVGDVAFQQKCFDRMQQVAANGTTVLLVSHNLAGVRELCPRAALMHHGRLVFDGPTEETMSRYYGLLGEAAATGEGAVRVCSMSLLGGSPVESGREASFRLELDAEGGLPPYILWMGIGTPGLAPIYTEILGEGPAVPPGGRMTIDLRLPLPLPDGDYVLQVALRDPGQNAPIVRAGPLPFRVTGRPSVTGLVDLHAEFAVSASG